MSRIYPALLLALAFAAPAPAAGLLLPADGGAPLAMRSHHVSVAIDEQVAVTRVEQTFRNPTSRALEATYVFPVPKGASVNKFSMWIDGKEVKGELVEAEQARQIYTDIVRKLQDPGLLEYVGSNLLKLRVFPVPANGDQKIAVQFTSVNEHDAGLTSYVYPLRTDGKHAATENDFTMDVSITSKEAVQNVYSPTHPVVVKHKNDNVAKVRFEKKQADLSRDFQLYYSLGKGDVGLTGLTHRPVAGQPGHVMLLLSPRAELSKTQEVPRDFVFVMDTSGSMAGPKMEQARKALLYCVNQLKPNDRFAVLNFATTVSQFADGLSKADQPTIESARKWVRELQPTGGTAIDAALQAALKLRTNDAGRPFTVVFFTDGEPTVGESRPDEIVKRVTERNTAQTRLFTFGIGDDVNATLLDRLADATKAVSTYVRPQEDVEAKVSAMYAKISHPVMTDLKLTLGDGVRLTETYPATLPDLFHGGQVVVLARYTGKGATTVELTGKVGSEERHVTYEMKFPESTGEERAFVEQLWARRKVGYLLDEIRRNGEKAELKDEVVKLAKKHGITTPYTSYLVVPDVAATPMPTVLAPRAEPAGTSRAPLTRGMYGDSFGRMSADRAAPPMAGAPMPMNAPMPTSAPTYANPGYVVQNNVSNTTAGNFYAPADANHVRQALQNGRANTGKLGVDLAVTLDEMRNQSQAGEAKAKKAYGRTCNEVNGTWTDETYDAKMPTLRVKALGAGYFRLLAKHPKLGEVFKLGTRVIWVTPSGTALVIDPNAGAETVSDEEIEKLFRVK